MSSSEELNLQSDKVLTAAFKGLKRFVKRNAIFSSLYILGLLFAAFGAGFHVDPTSAATFEHTITKLHSDTHHELSRIMQKVEKADRLYRQHKGWFSCDPQCMKYYEQVETLKLQLAEMKEKRVSMATEARKTVGAWSVYGITDLRNAFWDSWEQGKEAARRMTMFDTLFIALGSMSGYNNRDDSFLLTVFQIILQYIINLTIGLFTSLVIFLIESWYIITSYGPSILSALSLFFLVVCSAAATVLTALGGLFGGLFGSVYFMMRNAEKRARLEGSTRIGSTRLHWE